MKKRLLIATYALALVALASATWVLADEPSIWIKTDGVNEITPALTDETTTFADDEGSEFVHKIQWDKVDDFSDENAWRTAADIISIDGFISVTETLDWVYSNYGGANLVDDDTNYGAADAWANPEQTLNQGSGDSEDLVFLLASLLKWHTDKVEVGDVIFVNLSPFLPSGPRGWVFWFDVSELDWHQLDPTTGNIDGIALPVAGTLWLNDAHVFGFLPGYYPGPMPPVGGHERGDFGRIADGGFDDPMNTYPWSMAAFDGELYVGTARNFPWQLIEFLEFLFGGLLDFVPFISPTGDIGEHQWAEDMRAEIWRNRSWEQVYQSPVVGGPPYYPRESGFRQMVTFNGELYAAKGGLSASGGDLVLKSADGNTWELVETPPEMGTDSRAMAFHNGRLYVGTGADDLFGGEAQIWAYPSNPTPWERVADFSDVQPYSNTAVVSLASFNGHLYAGTQNIENGYQVFRSDDATPKLDGWTQVVKDGGGDRKNYWAGTMEVFKDRLYVGSLSWPFKAANGGAELTLPKGFELIRIAPDALPGEYELVIGDWVPQIPPAGPELRLPASGWPGGFGNLFNLYCWSLEEDDGVLYLGTFDATTFLRFAPAGDLVESEGFSQFVAYVEENQDHIVVALENVIGLLRELGIEDHFIEPYEDLLAALETKPIDWDAVWEAFSSSFAGADLWKTEDGIRWEPVTLNGFGNPENYGVRNMLQMNPLYVGMSNPFEGLEIWQAPAAVAVGGQTRAVDKAAILSHWIAFAGLVALVALTVVVIRRRTA